MTEFREVFDDQFLTCPYCAGEIEHAGEWSDEEEQVVQCHRCGKLFYGRVEIELTYFSRPDCLLNGAAHRDNPRAVRGYDRCAVCGRFKIRKEG